MYLNRKLVKKNEKEDFAEFKDIRYVTLPVQGNVECAQKRK